LLTGYPFGYASGVENGTAWLVVRISQPTWFGTFPTLASAQEWATKHRVIARFVEVIPPSTPESEWSESRFVDTPAVDSAVLSLESSVALTPFMV
jgi:hypothetical protein